MAKWCLAHHKENFLYTIFKPYQINENQIFEVKKGTSFTQIIKQLENIGVSIIQSMNII